MWVCLQSFYKPLWTWNNQWERSNKRNENPLILLTLGLRLGFMRARIGGIDYVIWVAGNDSGKGQKSIHEMREWGESEPFYVSLVMSLLNYIFQGRKLLFPSTVRTFWEITSSEATLQLISHWVKDPSQKCNQIDWFCAYLCPQFLSPEEKSEIITVFSSNTQGIIFAQFPLKKFQSIATYAQIFLFWTFLIAIAWSN